jgi:hypothetical protein
MTRDLRALTVLAFAALLTGCIGPRTPLEVGVKDVPTDVLYGGKRNQGALPPPPSININPGFPILIQPPPRGRTSTASGPIAAPAPCPTAHPFAAPTYEARTRGRRPPIQNAYPFRNNGTFENTGGRSSKGTFPVNTIRIVKNPQKASDGSFSFDVEEGLGDRTTTTTYDVNPESPLTDLSGVFIKQIRTHFFTGGGDDVFSPQSPGVKILHFPAEPGAAWDSHGADPLSQTAMNIHAQIGKELPDGDDADTNPDLQAKAKVDACGQPLEAWYVQIKDGQIVGPQTNLTFNALYAIAPQYGGFPVMEEIEVKGTNRGLQTNSKNVATINKEPAFPGES